MSGSQSVLQQFLAWASNFPPVQKCQVRGVLSGRKQQLLLKTGQGLNATDLEVEMSPTLNRYQCGRNSNHLMGVPFDCDLCSFRNVFGRQPCVQK
jgi:hypothetical protein